MTQPPAPLPATRDLEIAHVAAILYFIAGAVATAVGLGMMIIGAWYGAFLGAPLVCLGAFWLHSVNRLHRQLAANWLSRVLAVLSAMILLLFWRANLSKFATGVAPTRPYRGDAFVLGIVLVATFLGLAALSITVYLARRVAAEGPEASVQTTP